MLIALPSSQRNQSSQRGFDDDAATLESSSVNHNPLLRRFAFVPSDPTPRHDNSTIQRVDEGPGYQYVHLSTKFSIYVFLVTFI